MQFWFQFYFWVNSNILKNLKVEFKVELCCSEKIMVSHTETNRMFEEERVLVLV